MAETNLNNLALRLKGIIDTAIDGIITINQKGIIETVNSSAAKQFLYAPEELIGQNISILMPNPHRAAHDNYINRYIKTRKANIIGIGRKVMGCKKNGTLFPFRLAVSEVVLNDRIIFTGIIHDLTEVTEAKQKLTALNEALEDKVEQRTNELEQAVNRLLQSNKQLEQRENELQIALEKEKELNELKSRFVSMASHEFRTPLSTIMSSASLIAKYPLTKQDDHRQKHVNRIKSAVNNLTGILNDFLSLSKIEEGKIEIEKSHISLQLLCENISDELSGILKEGQQIIHQHPQGVDTIYTDARILKNILFNILSNAIKYSPANKSIHCTLSIKENILTFEIKDEGIGIPQNEQKHLFTRFFRATNVETIKGTGLGLSIVKRYLDLLNGNIFFESQQGKGTSFFIEIPMQ